jgi:hypothetical protein
MNTTCMYVCMYVCTTYSVTVRSARLTHDIFTVIMDYSIETLHTGSTEWNRHTSAISDFTPGRSEASLSSLRSPNTYFTSRNPRTVSRKCTRLSLKRDLFCRSRLFVSPCAVHSRWNSAVSRGCCSAGRPATRRSTCNHQHNNAYAHAKYIVN